MKYAVVIKVVDHAFSVLQEATVVAGGVPMIVNDCDYLSMNVTITHVMWESSRGLQAHEFSDDASFVKLGRTGSYTASCSYTLA